MPDYKTYTELKNLYEPSIKNTFNPQKTDGKPYKEKVKPSEINNELSNYRAKIKQSSNESGQRFPKSIIKFKPDILFSVDSPDFTLRVAEKVKKLNNDIKTIHYVAPQVWVWREGRVKKFKKFLDHILLLFDFEKKYFDKENIPNTFVGHPLLEEESKNKIDLKRIKEDNIEIDTEFAFSENFDIVNQTLSYFKNEKHKINSRHIFYFIRFYFHFM